MESALFLHCCTWFCEGTYPRKSIGNVFKMQLRTTLLSNKQRWCLCRRDKGAKGHVACRVDSHPNTVSKWPQEQFCNRSVFLNLSCRKQRYRGSFGNLVSHHNFKVELKKRVISTLYWTWTNQIYFFFANLLVMSTDFSGKKPCLFIKWVDFNPRFIAFFCSWK